MKLNIQIVLVIAVAVVIAVAGAAAAWKWHGKTGSANVPYKIAGWSWGDGAQAEALD
jgi:hypothetical protein